MAETPSSVGALQPIYLGGYNLALPPATIQETPFRAETAERMADSFTVIDRPALSLLDPTFVTPDVIQKMVWSLAWPSVNGADYEIFTEIESLPGFLDFTMWKPLVETFSGDGVSEDFVILRRRADTVLTPPAGVVWTPSVKIDGSVGTLPTFGTPDPVLGVTPISFASAPSNNPSNVRLFYTPLYKVRVVSPTRNFSVPFSEARTLQLEEI